MKNWSLNKKVAFLIGIFVVACVLITSSAIYNMTKMDDASSQITKVLNKRIMNYLNLRGLAREAAIQQRNILIAESSGERDSYKQNMDKLEAQFKTKWDQSYSVATEEGKKGLEVIRDRFAEWINVSAKAYEAAAKGDIRQAHDLGAVDALKMRQALEEKLADLIDLNQGKIDEEVVAVDNVVKQSRWLMILISLTATFSGVIVAWFVLKALSRSIDKVISDLAANSSELNSAASSIASSSEELSQAATEQAASLQETVSSVDEISSMVAKNSENSTEAAQTSTASQQNAEKGKQVVNEMIQAIGSISEGNAKIMAEIDESNRSISDIVTVIAEIGNKTKVINDIVFQTKLLSFNASVEAARAGEHGKGFAVVAEEVGNLAQMSGNAAKEISSLLDGSIKKVEGIVAATKSKVTTLVADGKQRVDLGVNVASQCGQVLDEIVSSISKVAVAANEIATASNEQAQGVAEINKAMAQLDQVTQQNSTASQHTASAAEQVARQAEGMNNIVKMLISTIKGADGVGIRTEIPKTNLAKVIPIHTVEPPAVSDGRTKLKKAAGYDSVPSEDHPGFKDI